MAARHGDSAIFLMDFEVESFCFSLESSRRVCNKHRHLISLDNCLLCQCSGKFEEHLGCHNLWPFIDFIVMIIITQI
jgi:hypothetical protein